MNALPERIASKVRDTGSCWEWAASVDDKGYGNVWFEGRTHKAHRVVFELMRGPIPVGLDIDHLCRNRKCVNPDHLEPVTRQVNLLRGDTIQARNAAKTHCPRGHAYTPENTWRSKRGQRKCRACFGGTPTTKA